MSDTWALAVEELLKRTHGLGTGVKECVDLRNLRGMSLYSLLASVLLQEFPSNKTEASKE